MLTLIATITAAVLPLAVVVGLLILAERVQRARDARMAWQVAVTDAIHRELGPVVAPAVSKPLWGRCRLVLPLPLGRPATVGTVLAIVQRVLAQWEVAAHEPIQIVLIPQPEPSAARVRRVA